MTPFKISGASGEWNGLTSRIKDVGAFTLEAPSGVDVAAAGTVVIVANDTGGALKVMPGGSPFGGADMDVCSIWYTDFCISCTQTKISVSCRSERFRLCLLHNRNWGVGNLFPLLF